jgi:hypothetical protein
MLAACTPQGVETGQAGTAPQRRPPACHATAGPHALRPPRHDALLYALQPAGRRGHHTPPVEAGQGGLLGARRTRTVQPAPRPGARRRGSATGRRRRPRRPRSARRSARTRAASRPRARSARARAPPRPGPPARPSSASRTCVAVAVASTVLRASTRLQPTQLVAGAAKLLAMMQAAVRTAVRGPRGGGAAQRTLS